MTPAAGFSFLLLVQKETKKTPANENCPFAGYSSVHLLYYCKLNSGFSMLSPDRLYYCYFGKVGMPGNF
jgi:hypothetical protein